MENNKLQKTVIVSIQGWELEVYDGPQKVHVDLLGDMLQFKGIWLTEPERGLVTVLTQPNKIFYLEITESELPLQRTCRKSKVMPFKRNHTQTPKETDE